MATGLRQLIKRARQKLLPRHQAVDAGNRHFGMSLDRLLAHLPHVRRLQHGDLAFADRVVINTQNSRYELLVVGHGEYLVSGGWFDRKRLSPHRIRINGATWGGSILWRDTVAAPGMCIEFANRVTTSPVRDVVVYRPGS